MILVWKIIFIILSFGCFLSFAWAIRSHFSNDDRPIINPGMRLIALLGTISFLIEMSAIMLNDDYNVLATSAALLLYLISTSIFWWAVRATTATRLTLAFTGDEPEFLLQTGPYRLVRHPFYLAYSLFWIAGVFAGNSLFLAVVPAAMIGLYYRAATFEEHKFIASDRLRNKYENYRAKTGMLVPKIFGK